MSVERTDSVAIRQGAVLGVKVTAVFNHPACDNAASSTAIFAKGAEIIERSDWARVDSFSLSKSFSVRIKSADEAMITAVMTKHDVKETKQLRLAVEK